MPHRLQCVLSTLVIASLTVILPGAGTAQVARFITVGGGASFPTGSASRGMNTGWLAEFMGGLTLPGNVVSLRLGASYGQNTMDAVPGGNMMAGVEGGIERSIAAMAGVMIMPDLDRDLIPYVLAVAGVMNSRFHGSTTSLAWATGVGTHLQTDIADFYAEWRFVQTKKEDGQRRMIPLTAGIRIGTW